MDVKHVAILANLVLSPDLLEKFTSQFTDTLSTIAVINELDTQGVPPTSQVTGLSNVTRPDTVDTSRMLSQSVAISPASASHNGYIVVPAIFHE